MRFNGGVSVDKKGYPVVKAGPCRDVRVHTLVAEGMIGRKLHEWEDVHHKDGNKMNPRWTNLQVIDRREHGRISNAQKRAYMKRHPEAREKDLTDYSEAARERESIQGVDLSYEALGYKKDIDGNIIAPDGTASVPF